METAGLHEAMVYTKHGRSDNTNYAQGRGIVSPVQCVVKDWNKTASSV